MLLMLVLTMLAAPPEGWHRVAVDDAGRTGAQPRRVTGADWTYGPEAVAAEAVPLDHPARTVAFGERVQFTWRGLKPAARYGLRLELLSDGPGRAMRLELDGRVLVPRLELPEDQLLVRYDALPEEAVADGLATLELVRLSGPNAVVGTLELWSDREGLLPFLTVDAAGDLSGGAEVLVRDAAGQPAAGARVRVEGEGSGPVTDAAGRARVAIPRERFGPDALVPLVANLGEAAGTARVAWVEAHPPRYLPWPAEPKAVDLSGRWDFCPAPPTGFPGEPGDGWQPIRVPGEWAMQGFSVPAGQAAAYRRQVTVPVGWRGRIMLRFEAVYSQATVWLGGRALGEHEGGFTPFEFDLTDHLRPGESAELALLVRNESAADRLASGTAYAAHPLGGISRRVTLYAVPELHLAELRCWSTFDASFRRATLHVAYVVRNAGARASAPAELNLALADPAGKGVPLTGNAVRLPALDPGAELRGQFHLALANSQTWDPEHPRRYALAARLRQGGALLETCWQRLGLRQIEVRGQRVLVNGRPVMLRGVCRHEVDPRHGRALTGDIWRRDAELFRAANVNFIRTSHYPPAEELLEACDALGLFVELEAPFCWARGDDPAERSLVVRQTLEAVARDRNHPSVLLWSLANESQWGPNFAAAAAAVKRFDPTRPRIFSYTGEGLEIDSWHYPGPGGPARAAASERPVLFDEYCHLNCYNRRELEADPGVRDLWGELLEPMWTAMLASPGCLGGALWAGIDEVFERPDGGEIGYGAWGVIDGERRAKPETWHVRKAYSPVRLALACAGPGQPIRLTIDNRCDFSDLAELTLVWRRGGQAGRIAARGAPGTRFETRLPGTLADGESIMVEACTPDGRLLDEEVLQLDTDLDELAPPPVDKLDLLETATSWQVTAGRHTLTFDRATGLLREATSDGAPVLLAGPTLVLLPRDPNDGGTTHRSGLEPLLGLCDGWRAEPPTTHVNDAFTLSVAGGWEQARGTLNLRYAAGELTAAYDLALGDALEPRQVGLAFALPASFRRLAWQRRGFWSDYPEDHLGRPFGVAEAVMPIGPWSHDPHPLGCADFRATRRNVVWATLTDADGRGVRARGGGTQSVRAWLDGERAWLLVADLDTGTGESFLSSDTAHLRRPLAAGARVTGTARLELLP